jgi:hypothetical protein
MLLKEPESRKIVKDAGAVMPLTTLLFGSDIPSQTSALGALMNASHFLYTIFVAYYSVFIFNNLILFIAFIF